TIPLRVVHPSTKVAGLRCPFCQDPFEVGQAVILCPRSATPHHVECWNDGGSHCSCPSACDGNGRIDWLAPLWIEVEDPKPVGDVDADSLPARMSRVLGTPFSSLHGLPLFSAFSAELGPAYRLALQQWVALEALNWADAASMLESRLLGWQV